MQFYFFKPEFNVIQICLFIYLYSTIDLGFAMDSLIIIYQSEKALIDGPCLISVPQKLRLIC